MGTLLVTSSLHKGLSYDELDNLAYGYRCLVKGPSTPPNGQRMPILALNALACSGSACRGERLNTSEGARILVRLPTILFALLLAATIYAWTRELFGPAAGLLSLAVYVFNPNFLAHGKQITSDVQAAFFTLLAVYSFWRLEKQPNIRGVLLCALATSGALLSKYTGVLLFPIYLILAGAKIWSARRRLAGRDLALLGAGGLGLGVLVLLFLNAAYLFRGTWTRADHYEWRSLALQFLRSWSVPLPLPKAFVLGLDFSFYLQEHPGLARGSNYILGSLNTDGVPYAFPLMLLLKTPLAALLLLGIALWGKARGLAFLLVPFVVILAFYSLVVKPQLGVRYVLPAVALLLVLSGRALCPGRRGRLKWVLALLGWNLVSTLSYHPHFMSYFNELIGRRINAYRFLADSNLDWEDVTYFIEEFRHAHPDIPFVLDPKTPQSGYLLVGANQLVGIFDPERFRWLRENFKPIGQVAYSHLLFFVPPDQLKALGLHDGAGG